MAHNLKVVGSNPTPATNFFVRPLDYRVSVLRTANGTYFIGLSDGRLADSSNMKAGSFSLDCAGISLARLTIRNSDLLRTGRLPYALYKFSAKPVERF